MSMVFPGMDPYLEDPLLWPGVHHAMIVYIRDHLRPSLRPRYIAALGERVYIEGPGREVIPDVRVRRSRTDSLKPVQPDLPRPLTTTAVLDEAEPLLVRAPSLEVHEPYITILDLESGQKVVTVLELLSPSNKYAGPGRESYVQKQLEVRASDAQLVEIDLLRAGPHVLAVPEYLARGKAGDYDYLVCVNRASGLRDVFELYPRRLRDRLPRVGIPLAEDDADVWLDLPAVLAQTYEAGSYSERINYTKPCVPHLSPDDRVWADELIRRTRLTSSD